jgi:hypothetical protein
LRSKKTELQHMLALSAADRSTEFAASHVLDVETLQALLNQHFPDRQRDPAAVLELLEEMRQLAISLEELEAGIKSATQTLARAEFVVGVSWNQVGAARHSLDVGSEKYFRFRRQQLTDHELELAKRKKST